jgi:hypothetical protein
MKKWEATVEVNMDASHWETIEVEANTERKARKFVEEKAKKIGFFFVKIVSIKEVPNEMS